MFDSPKIFFAIGTWLGCQDTPANTSGWQLKHIQIDTPVNTSGWQLKHIQIDTPVNTSGWQLKHI